MQTPSFIRLFEKIKKWKTQHELRWQRILDCKGIGFRTRVQDIIKAGNSVNGYRKIYFHAMLRANGKTVCRKMKTLVKVEETLRPGDKILIRFLPGKINHVMISNFYF